MTLNPGDTCASATTIFSGVTITGDTRGLTNDYTADGTGTCFNITTNRGPDGVYAFTPSQTGSYKFVATPQSSSFDLSLYLLQGSCPSGNVGTCVVSADNGAAGVAETVTATLNAGTTYFVVIDGYQATDQGPFTLLVDVANAGETCTTAQPLRNLTGAGSSQTIQDTTVGAADDFAPTCGSGSIFGTSSGDKVYTFTTTDYVALSATVSTTDSSYTPILALANSGCAQIDCSLASAGGSASISQPQLAPGTYFLVVDGDDQLFGSGTNGPFTLTVSLSAPVQPPSNDVCNGAILVSANSTTNLDTTYSRNDTNSSPSGPCGGSGHGGDLVYKVVVPSGSSAFYLTASVSGVPSPVVYIRNQCEGEYPDGGAAAGYVEYDCGDNATDGGPTASVLFPGAGTYYIWVDDYAGTYGAGTLDVTLQ